MRGAYSNGGHPLDSQSTHSGSPASAGHTDSTLGLRQSASTKNVVGVQERTSLLDSIQAGARSLLNERPKVTVSPHVGTRPGVMNEEIGVVIINQQTLLIEGLKSLLNSAGDIEVIGTAGSGTEAFQLVEKLHPDVILVDLACIDPSGVGIAQMINERAWETKVILFGTSLIDTYAVEALEAGVAGYLTENATNEELLRAIRDVVRGNVYLSNETSKKLLTTMYQDKGAPSGRRRMGTITAREREILDLIADGVSNREISQLLFVSPKTVETHKRNIMAKLGLERSSELTRYAMLRSFMRRGWNVGA